MDIAFEHADTYKDMKEYDMQDDVSRTTIEGWKVVNRTHFEEVAKWKGQTERVTDVCPRQSIQQVLGGTEGGRHFEAAHHPQQPINHKQMTEFVSLSIWNS